MDLTADQDNQLRELLKYTTSDSASYQRAYDGTSKLISSLTPPVQEKQPEVKHVGVTVVK